MAGISLNDKISFLYFGLALAAGLVLTSQRSHFRRRQLWVGAGIALVLLAPYVLWNIAHGLPTVDFWRNYGSKLYPVGPLEFILQQIQVMHPLTLPVWLAGLVCFFLPSGKPFRPLGWMYLVLLAVFMIQGAKFYFLAPYYPVLLAAGGFQIERFLAGRRLLWARPAALAAIGLGGLIIAPGVMPLLPLEMEIRYQEVFNRIVNVKIEAADSGVLAQTLADQLGWPELAGTFAGFYSKLPEEEKAKACIIAGNYGEAGALEFFGPAWGLPPVVSGHNSYFLWGPGQCTGEVILYYGYASERELRSAFDSVEWLGMTHCHYCMPYENNRSVYLCKGIKMPLVEIWQEVKHYD